MGAKLEENKKDKVLQIGEQEFVFGVKEGEAFAGSFECLDGGNTLNCRVQ